MSWLTPAAAWWLLLLPALVALYMFRPRARRKVVSSLRLWQALPRVDRPRMSVRRPPLSLLLVLQALLLLAGAIALIRPAFSAPAPRLSVILVDASGSMQTVHDGTGRFQQARNEAMRIAGEMRDEDRATLIRVGSGVSTGCAACNRTDMEHAISGLRAGGGEADWPQALDVAAGLSSRVNGGRIDTYLISDGAFEPLEPESLPAALHFVPVGSQAGNHAITVLSARRPPDGSPGYTAYARVENMSTSPASLDANALADTVPLPGRKLDIPAGGHADLIYQVPVGTVRFSLNLGPADDLAADDHATLYLPVEGQYKARIFSQDPDLYSRVLAGVAGLRTVISDTQAAPEGPLALTLIEGKLPTELPAGSLLLVAPEGNLLPSGEGDIRGVQPQPVVSDHPLLEGVDLAPLVVDQARKLQPVPWLEPVLTSDQGPLILAGEQNGRRVVVLAFDPHDSNLPKLLAFPLLMSNIVDWLYPPAGKQALRPGEPLYVGPGENVTTPTGKAQVGASGVLVNTEDVGLYSAEGSGSTTLQFAVNMVSETESNIAPREHPELNRPAEQAEERQVTREYWSPLAGLALLLAGAEWLFYCWKRGQA
ncbi:MAG TPA: VWA domain-containing protein [Chloroflexia bacterium]|nr:VWA domain-containing protein [Chloroflexia bacterium]